MAGSEHEAVEVALRRAVAGTAKLRRHVATLSTSAAGSVNVSEAKASHQSATAAISEASEALKAFRPKPSSSVSEQSLQKLREQKLKESLKKADDDLKEAWTSWQKAEEAQKKAVAAAAAALADAPEGAAATAATGPSTGQTMMATRGEISSGEANLHAAIVDEYAQDAERVSQQVREMQRALLDIAQIAQAQGETLDNIESGVSGAASSTGRGVRELQVTSQRQQLSLKRMLCMVVAAVLLAAATCAAAVHRADLA
ncbi:pep12 [Symbiodinium sp. CCMP2592]|nr:pep12 [Symbiodinium sp. CCMP2592]